MANVKYLLIIDSEEAEMITKKSHTSFGKLILADEKNSPVFSFGGANRFSGGVQITTKQTPGPIYKMSNKFKFIVVSQL